MIYKARVSVLVVCFIVTSVPGSTQTPSKKKSASSSKTSDAERQSAVQIQRLTAMQMVTSLVDEADRYKDEALRAQVQARAADTLWDGDPLLSRELFLRAWKVAEKVDKESERLAVEARSKTLNFLNGGLMMLTPPSNIRVEVLKLAARRDTQLAESFLAKLSEAKEEDKSSSAARDSGPIFDPTEPTLAVAKRLEVATILLEKDVERAVTFAQPALKDVTTPGIIFLCALRHRDREMADELYSQLLLRAGEDLKSDATTVSLLSTYIFTPNLIVTATRRGRVMNPFANDRPVGEYSPTLRSNFFRIAASILLRPLPLPNQDATSAGPAGTFFTIARLLPLFEQYAPANVSALTTQMLLLSSEVPETLRTEDDIMLRAGLMPARTDQKEPLETLEQQIAKAGSAERDSLYLKAIQTGAPSGDGRIRDLAGKIEDINLKEQARTFADLAIVRSAMSAKDSDRVLRLIREGYLSPLHRVWAMATVASILGKTDSARAMDVLTEAYAEAMRIKVGEPTRVYALVSVATSLVELDRVRSREIAFEIVKSVNAVTDFNTEGGKLYAQVRTKNVVAMINVNERSFNIGSYFEKLSKEDLQLAISLANDVKPDAPRATATLAIAGLILKGKTGAAVSLRD